MVKDNAVYIVGDSTETEVEIFHDGAGDVDMDRMLHSLEYQLDSVKCDGETRQLFAEIITLLRIQQEQIEELKKKGRRNGDMAVFGSLRNERVGNILYKGNLEECQAYAKSLNMKDYYELSICRDDGTIFTRLVVHGMIQKYY